MSPQLKTQLVRILRLFVFAAAGVLIPYLSGLHGAPTWSAIEGVVIIACETGFRAIVPTIEASYLQDLPKDKPVPPAVF